MKDKQTGSLARRAGAISQLLRFQWLASFSNFLWKSCHFRITLLASFAAHVADTKDGRLGGCGNETEIFWNGLSAPDAPGRDELDPLRNHHAYSLLPGSPSPANGASHSNLPH